MLLQYRQRHTFKIEAGFYAEFFHLLFGGRAYAMEFAYRQFFDKGFGLGRLYQIEPVGFVEV